MATILPFLLIIVSLTAIIIVVVRKYPQLTMLDLDTITDVAKERKRDEIWKQRAQKSAEKNRQKIGKAMVPMAEKFKEVQGSFRKYVGNVEQRLAEQTKRRDGSPASSMGRKDTEAMIASKKQTIQSVLQNAQTSFDAGEFEKAEQKYIRAISLDKKNVEAYRGLADVYAALGQMEEAKQTYSFLTQLDPNDDYTLVRLADLAEEQGDIDQAIAYYQKAVLINDNLASRFAQIARLMKQVDRSDTALEAITQAVELEPKNPKYLDSLVEISIIVGDKSIAEEAFEQLKLVDPESAKLTTYRESIEHMES